MYGIGTKFKFIYEHDGLIEEEHSFILSEYHDDDFLFQIVCISGYHKGRIEGYISKENNTNFVSLEHLKHELNGNFIKIHWKSFYLFESDECA